MRVRIVSTDDRRLWVRFGHPAMLAECPLCPGAVIAIRSLRRPWASSVGGPSKPGDLPLQQSPRKSTEPFRQGVARHYVHGDRGMRIAHN
jgi:hypothetical protein